MSMSEEEEEEGRMAATDGPFIQIGKHNIITYGMPLEQKLSESEESISDDSEGNGGNMMEAYQNQEEDTLAGDTIDENTTLKDSMGEYSKFDEGEMEEDSLFTEEKMENSPVVKEEKKEESFLFKEGKMKESFESTEEKMEDNFIFQKDLDEDVMTDKSEDSLLFSGNSHGTTASSYDKEKDSMSRSDCEIETMSVEESPKRDAAAPIKSVEQYSIDVHHEGDGRGAEVGMERRENENEILTFDSACELPSTSTLDTKSSGSKKNTENCQQIKSLAVSLSNSGNQHQGLTVKHSNIVDGVAKLGSEPGDETKQNRRSLTGVGDASQSDLDRFRKQGAEAKVGKDPENDQICLTEDGFKKQKSQEIQMKRCDKTRLEEHCNKSEFGLDDTEKLTSESEVNVDIKRKQKDAKSVTKPDCRPALRVQQHGPNNKLAIHIGHCSEETFNLPENTEVRVIRKIKTRKKGAKKAKTRVCVIIEDEEDAENATFFMMNKKYFRQILDSFFAGISFVVDTITPGSIIIEIKPTSEHSVQSLLESVKDGSFNKIVRQILEQESVFKHIRGKKVTVNLEITIPEELLEEEGIVIIENTEMKLDEDSKVSVTVKEQDGSVGGSDDDDDDDDDEEDDDDGGGGAVGGDGNVASDENDEEENADADADTGFKKRYQESSLNTAGKSDKSEDEIVKTFHPSSQTGLSVDEEPSTSKDFSIASQEPHRKRYSDKLTLASLHDMLVWDSSEIILTLGTNQGSLKHILNHPHLKEKAIQHLIVLLGRVSTSSMTERVNEILFVVLQSKFFESTLPEYILNMDECEARLKDTLILVLKMSREILNKMPTDGFKKVQKIVFLLQGKWSQSELSDPEISKDIESLLSFLKVMKSQREKQERKTTGEVEDYSLPAESFRELPITAKKSELDGTEEILVLPNKIGSRFNDLEQYLECQFRLFRADVILPLKQNIEDFKKADMSMTTTYRAYTKVKILRPMCLDYGIGYRLAFDPTPFRTVQWERSQRLIFGSLLLLSNDGFKNDFMFATVDNREPNMLQKGLVDIQFLTDVDFEALPRGQMFDMVESQAYFESYKDVLKGMQTVTPESFPFQDYIVECRNIGREPLYLRKSKTFRYDLRPLVDDSVKITATARSMTKPTFSQESAMAETIKIQNKHSWPCIDNLDDSQIAAVQHALTREFALIQGPPGTGKTYVGLKILKVLLHNQSVWTEQGHQVPVLVVCYTNHALDQFLEGVLDMFEGGLIRVGGRIKSELLQKYSLREARQKIKDKKGVPSHLFEAKMKKIKSLKKLRKNMEKIARKIEAAEREIISASHLTEFMLEKHAAEFKRMTIQEWLGIESKLLNIDNDSEDFQDPENEDSDEGEDVGCYHISDSRQSRRQLEEDIFDEYEDPLDLGGYDDEEEKDLIAVDVTNLDNYKEQKFHTRLQRQESRKKAKKKRRYKNQLLGMIESDDVMGLEEQKQTRNPKKLPKKDKWRLYRFWVDKLALKARTDIKTFAESYKRVSQEFKDVLMDVDKSILKTCSVIGMTTTGAARYQRILNEIGPKIIIVEEAGEVLEAHIIGSLSKRCEHLILIGDHKQLRPNPTVHMLAKKYNLEISLFERMVKSEIRCDMLQWQHRMRPEIADVIRPIYDNLLKDHPLVQTYHNVRGVAKNIFFVDHQHDHSFDEETKSFRNSHEAEYLAALYRYLIKQGYKQSQITILTFYSAQIDSLNRSIPQSDFKGRRICAVDGYQGEENDIILLSLVRSKKEGRIGFLKEENRICVALSRAKVGMYVIGNFTHLTEHSNLLDTICKDAYKQNKIGPALPLCCPRHLDNIRVEALDPEDFLLAPEGGCKKKCDFRLPCDHVCTKVCHAGEHNFEQCSKPCEKRCKNGHQTCKKLCYQECSPCQETLKTTLKCGHVQNVPCCEDPMTFHCKEKCQDVLECGHRCTGFCGVPHPTCTVEVDAGLPCGHHVKTTCGQKDDPSCCNAPCSSKLECGHTCKGSCGSCHQGRLHQPCQAKCMNILICGHKCESTCNSCPPCQKDCEIKCSHRKCTKKCGDSCIPCKQPCEAHCSRHIKCQAECSQMCQRQRCNAKCKKKPECKHPCAGNCGETCPNVCGTCNKSEFDEIVASTGGGATPKPRLIVLEDCGHIFEVSVLDKLMDKSPEEGDDFGLKECPTCHSPIRQSKRYGDIVKETLEDVEKAKLKVVSSDRLMQLKETLTALSSKFKASYKVTVDKVQSSTAASEESLTAKMTQLQLLKKIASLEDNIARRLQSADFQDSVQVLLKQVDSFKSWITIERTTFSRQEVLDSSREINRLTFFFYCLAGLRSQCDITEDSRGRLKAWINRLAMPSMLTEKEMIQIATLKKELIQMSPALRVRECDEEYSFVESSGQNFNRKNWHKCKKGHVFAKAEKVNSQSELICPECVDDQGEGAVGTTPFRKGDNSFTDTQDPDEESVWTEEMDREFAMSLDQELNAKFQ